MQRYRDKIEQISKPAFHVGRPNLPDKSKVMQLFSEVFDNNWLTNMGPFSLELEERICQLLGVKHCICVCNATIGLELLQRALGLDGEVIIPAFTFVATAHSLRWQQIDPVFCDIRQEDHLIDPDKIEALITSRTTGILAVHLWGQPCHCETLQKIADKHNLSLIFDSAHAFGCKSGDQYLGTFGDAEVFSFHATKVMSSGEGGAITTNSDALAEKLRGMRNFGFTQYDQTSSIGTNAKMSEFTAAFGLANLDQLNSIISYNKKIYQAYRTSFRDLPDIEVLEYSPTNSSNFQYVVARVRPEVRDQLVEYYHRENVLVRRYFHPGVHLMEPYCSDSRYNGISLPNTETLASEVIVFPTGSQLDKREVTRFAEIYVQFMNQKHPEPPKPSCK